MNRVLIVVASLAIAAVGAACGDDIIGDNRGPPAGYAILNGTVQQADGGPAAGVEVSFSRCGDPIGGFLTSTTSTAAGTFQVEAHLPPVGLRPSLVAASVQLRCDVFLDRTGIARDSVVLRFAAAASNAPVTRLMLRLP